MEKKIVTILTMSLLISGSSLYATMLTNLTNFPARIDMVYNISCDASTPPAQAEYSFTIPSQQYIDISGRPGVVVKGKKGCETTILSIRATITFSDGTTELSRTWFGPFGNFINIGSSYPINASLPDTTLWLK